MVSVAGYLIVDYIAMVIATYVLLFFVFLTQYIRDVIEEKPVWKWVTAIGVVSAIVLLV